MERALAKFSVAGLGCVLALLLTLPGAGAASHDGGQGIDSGLGYIVPVAAESTEDPALRPAMPSGISVSDGSSMPLPLAHFRGQVLLMNFWATWCAPCIKEMAYLDRLQGDLKGMPLLVMPVSEDKGGIAVAKAFMQRQKLTFLRVYHDANGAAAETLAIQGLPTSFIIDKQGRLVQRVEGPYDWDNGVNVAKFRALVAEAP